MVWFTEGTALGPLWLQVVATMEETWLGIVTPVEIGRMLEGIEKILQWISADRSQKGDAHTAEVPELDDAWLTVHVVGAVLLRLSKLSPRT